MSAAEGFAVLAANSLTAALGAGGVPLTSQQPVTSARTLGSTVRGVVSFGPFAESVNASEVLIWVAGFGPESVPLVGGLGLPAGSSFTFDIDYEVSA